MGQVPVVIYAAKSTADVHGSIPSQVADCETAILREAGREIIAAPFWDESASAYSGNRGSGLSDAKAAAMKAAADSGGAELWVQHSDRLARGDGLAADHLAEVWFELRRASVRLRSVQDDASFDGVLPVAMMGERSFEDSRRKSGAVKSGKDRQMERGERLGGPVPDGLAVVVDRDAADRVLSRRYVLDPERASIIREVFALSESGYGDSAVAQRLNRRGLRTQTGKPWSRRRVQDTLTNQTYAGRVVRYRGKPNEEVVPASNVETLIEPERFDAIRAQRVGRDLSADGRARGRLGGRPTLRYALSKLAMCRRCGSSMYCQTSPYRRKDGTHARWYVCANVHAGTGTCDAPKVNAEVTDGAIIPHVQDFFDDFASWAQTISDAAGVEREQIRAKLAELEAKRDKLAAAESAAHDRYADALAAGDDERAGVIETALRKMTADEAKLSEKIAAQRAVMESLATAAAPSDAMRDYWSDVVSSIQGRLTESTALADVNAELRVAVQRVEIDTRADGRIELRAYFNRRGTWTPAMYPLPDEHGLISDDSDWEVHPGGEPEFTPDDVLIVTGAASETGAYTQEAWHPDRSPVLRHHAQSKQQARSGSGRQRDS